MGAIVTGVVVTCPVGLERLGWKRYDHEDAGFVCQIDRTGVDFTRHSESVGRTQMSPVPLALNA
jgi:hypothetical protein